MFKERLEPFGIIQRSIQPPFPRKIPLRKGETQSPLFANQFYAFQLRCFRETDMQQFDNVMIFSVEDGKTMSFRKMTGMDPLYKKIVSELAIYSDKKSRYSLQHAPEDYLR